MSCTTLLVGRNASYDGSTMIARNMDSGSGEYTPKKMLRVSGKNAPKKYKSVLSHVEIPLPEKALDYICFPDALGDKGIWAGAGTNSANVSVSATETITSNELVQAADPLVVLHKEGRKEIPGGIGEEDMTSLLLPYIHTAREGVIRLGELLEKYGTYEMNGVAFSDTKEIWWLETIGGHHFIAKKVPDDAYVMMANQQGIDSFDLEDAFGKQKEHICSKDLREFMAEHHLNLDFEGDFNPRAAFGSHSDADHVYNTPRTWYILRRLNPNTFRYEGESADFKPDSDDIPWAMVPERKITPMDVKYLLSTHFQGTAYDCYGKFGDLSRVGQIRPIGIERTSFLSLHQNKEEKCKDLECITWFTFGANVFNALIPMFSAVTKIPNYFSNTKKEVSTDSFYWQNRLIGAMADASYQKSRFHVERYQGSVQAKCYQLIEEYKKEVSKRKRGQAEITALLEECNEKIAAICKKETAELLDKVLYEASSIMKNCYSRSDA
ncbi:C69 family dipeptidase [Oribacterium sp. oral taxon 108]|jgi:dipeptidase|uniref:C69 family dipeptidase n=1 Tax=Oribacterium sp. oral taxon 108 TaxID=712414 RepID=UPI00020DD6CA|nr:C69 family dipeptidase [Oribacterium sp. oral taxon 108]EGL37943.1 putative dipeptidase B [Oribacterium sp. oral taxon 108 str. F0425]